MSERKIETLNDVRAGDEVYYSSRYAHTILKVVRTTKTLIICESNKKFRKDTGFCTPLVSKYSCDYIQVLTDDIRKKHKEAVIRQKYIFKIRKMNWEDLSTESLEKIYKLLI